MKTILNLSDIAITIFEQDKFDKTIRQMDALKKDLDEIYLGSYFCEKYFLHIGDDIFSKVKDLCHLRGIKLSLVIPMASEKDLQRVKDRIDYVVELLSSHISSLVINDFGMLEYVSQRYSFPITLGRLLYKQSRDIRYEVFRDGAFTCEVCSAQFHQLIKDYPIKAIELDDIRANTVIENKFGYGVYVHSPLVYSSTGMVCEYASAGVPNTKRFRPNSPCAHQCSKYCTSYVGVNQKQYFKLGRTVYYPGDMRAAMAENVDKEIYFPFESVRESYENISSVKQ